NGGYVDLMAQPRIVVMPYPWHEIPWHRKRRIAKKWRKQRGPRRRSVPVKPQDVFYDPVRYVIYCYPEAVQALEAAMAEKHGYEGATEADTRAVPSSVRPAR